VQGGHCVDQRPSTSDPMNMVTLWTYFPGTAVTTVDYDLRLRDGKIESGYDSMGKFD